MEWGHVEANDRNRSRLVALVDRLSEDDLARRLDNGWTVAAALTHIAHWDRWVVARWDRYEREGAIAELPEAVPELANAASLPEWLALTPRRAAELALSAAEEVDRRLAGLAPDAVAQALASGRAAMVDRSRHRGPHLDEIERALAD